MKSCGEKHSRAVKAGLRRYRESLTPAEWADMNQRGESRARFVGLVGSMQMLLRKLAIPLPDPDELDAKLRAAYRRGYVQALRDVKRERELAEAASYRAAMRSTSYRDLATFSHRFENET